MISFYHRHGSATVDDVVAIHSWRWPGFFPLGAAIRRKLIDRIVRVPIPAALEAFPTMRNGGRGGQPWREHREGKLGGLGSKTEDRELPIVHIVNDTRLKELLVSGWMPADRW